METGVDGVDIQAVQGGVVWEPREELVLVIALHHVMADLGVLGHRVKLDIVGTDIVQVRRTLFMCLNVILRC